MFITNNTASERKRSGAVRQSGGVRAAGNGSAGRRGTLANMSIESKDIKLQCVFFSRLTNVLIMFF